MRSPYMAKLYFAKASRPCCDDMKAPWLPGRCNRTSYRKFTNLCPTDDEESESSDNESPVTKTALPTRRGKFDDEEEDDDVSLPIHFPPTQSS